MRSEVNCWLSEDVICLSLAFLVKGAIVSNCLCMDWQRIYLSEGSKMTYKLLQMEKAL